MEPMIFNITTPISTDMNRKERLEEFKCRIEQAFYLTGVMKTLEHYLTASDTSSEIKSECGTVVINYIKDHSVSLSVLTHNTNFKMWDKVGQIYINTIVQGNNVSFNSISFSPLNKNSRVEYCDDYRIVYPYEHNEAAYFQNLTMHDLPDEEYYQEASRYLQSVKELECVYYTISLGIITDEHIALIDNLVESLRTAPNAQYY